MQNRRSFPNSSIFFKMSSKIFEDEQSKSKSTLFSITLCPRFNVNWLDPLPIFQVIFGTTFNINTGEIRYASRKRWINDRLQIRASTLANSLIGHQPSAFSRFFVHQSWQAFAKRSLPAQLKSFGHTAGFTANSRYEKRVLPRFRATDCPDFTPPARSARSRLPDTAFSPWRAKACPMTCAAGCAGGRVQRCSSSR